MKDKLFTTENNKKTIKPEILKNLLAPDLAADKTELKKQFSRFAETTCQIALAAGMPNKFVSYLTALAAVSRGRDEFECANRQIALVLRDSRGIKLSSAERLFRLNTAAFLKWQTQSEFELIRRRCGGRDARTRRYYPSSYRLPFADVVAEVEMCGGWSKLSIQKREEIISNLKTKTGSPLTPSTEAAKSPPNSPRQKITAQLKTAATYIKNARHAAVSDSEIIRLLQQIITDAEQTLAELDFPATGDCHGKTEKRINGKADEFVPPILKTEDGFAREGGTGGHFALLPGIDEGRRATPAATTKNLSPPPAADICELRRSAAAQALTAFASVGVTDFHSVFVNDTTDKAQRQVKDNLASFAEKLPGYLIEADRRKSSVCVRPGGGHLIQLDDLTGQDIEKLSEMAFLTIETSKNNYQCWLAVAAGCLELRGQLRRQLIENPSFRHIDKMASGSLRFPGTRNFKQIHAGDNFPPVKTIAVNLQRFITDRDVAAAFPPVPPKFDPKPRAEIERSEFRLPRAFPSWNMVYDRAPLNAAGTATDRSIVDFRWSVLALRWGHSPENVMAELPCVSEKAAACGRAYVERTVRAAAARISG